MTSYGSGAALIHARVGVLDDLEERVDDHRVELVAPLVRGIRSELPVGKAEGLPAGSAASCDNLITVDKRVLDPTPAGRLSTGKAIALDAALRFALGVRY